jgi:hypothetical protein
MIDPKPVGRNEVGINIDDQTGDSRYWGYIDKDGDFKGKYLKRQQLADLQTPFDEDHAFLVNEMQLVVNETDLIINHEQF